MAKTFDWRARERVNPAQGGNMTPIRFKGGEFAFIDWIRKRTKSKSRMLVGPGDDCCLFDLSPDGRVAATTDMLLEGTHFDLSATSAFDVGWKSAGVSLSDVAAMGMEPVALLAAVGLPNRSKRRFAEEIYRGMRALCDRFGVPIAGGDVTSWKTPLTVICTTALGRCPEGVKKPVLRSGARVGDVILVTGSLGGSLLGRHARIEPRVSEGIEIARRFRPHAMMDISDGLSSDLAHICIESKVGAVVDELLLPVSADARKMAKKDGRTPADHALGDGEDFELLITMAPRDAKRLVEAKPFGTRVSMVGRIVRGRSMRLIGADGLERALEPGGYEHLR
jgi:thiamine-monophosphate kinase